MGLLGLAAFFWALKRGQFEDLDGAANRILIDEEEAECREAESACSRLRRLLRCHVQAPAPRRASLTVPLCTGDGQVRCRHPDQAACPAQR